MYLYLLCTTTQFALRLNFFKWQTIFLSDRKSTCRILPVSILVSSIQSSNCRIFEYFQHTNCVRIAKRASVIIVKRFKHTRFIIVVTVQNVITYRILVILLSATLDLPDWKQYIHKCHRLPLVLW